MKVGGLWAGWGPGGPGADDNDNDPKVQDMKRYLKYGSSRKPGTVKFSYAQVLDDTTIYDGELTDAIGAPTMTGVVKEMQQRYGLTPTGIMNAATQEKCGYWRPAPPVLPTLYTVCGTGVPWWVGPDAEIGRVLGDNAHIFRWQPVGYPAAPFPMWPSIMSGVAELARLVEATPGEFDMIGYSQGAVVVSYFYKYYLLRGVLNHRLPDLRKVVTFGNPMREEGQVWHDGVGEPARPNTAGILEDRLKDTPDFWRDYAHKGDLYTDCELDNEGEFKRSIGKIIMGNNVFGGRDSIIAQLIELGLNPFGEGMAVAMALLDAGMFFASGTKPHTNYNVQPAIEWLKDVS